MAARGCCSGRTPRIMPSPMTNAGVPLMQRALARMAFRSISASREASSMSRTSRSASRLTERATARMRYRDDVPHRVQADFTVVDVETLAHAACLQDDSSAGDSPVSIAASMAFPMRSAAACRSRSPTWAYRRVITGSACPSIRATVDRGTPRATAWLATVCLRSCRRTSSSPASFRARCQRCSVSESGLPGSVAKSGWLVTCLRDLERGVEA